jgi:hypothetical protein
VSVNLQTGTYQTWSYGCTWFPKWDASGYGVAYNWFNSPTWPIEVTVPYTGYYPVPAPSITVNPGFGFAGDTVDIQWFAGGIAATCTGINFSTGGNGWGIENVTLPATPATYSVSCTNVTGTGSASFTVDPPPPVITFSAYPTYVSQGQPTTLDWSATNATSCTGDGNFSTGGLITGTDIAYPSADTTFTISCVGAGPESVYDVTVDVGVPCPENETCEAQE